MTQNITLNGVALENGRFAHQPQLLERIMAWQGPEGSTELQSKDVAAGVEPLELDSAGWAVIFHEADRACLEALEPLLKLRRQQAGFAYHDPILYHKGETASAFLDRFQASESEADPDQLPYYLLIVGPPERISFSFQCELDLAYAVGRISFDQSEDYARYAANVIRGESTCANGTRVVAFATNNNDPLTDLSVKDLILPLSEKIAAKRRRGRLDWELETIQGGDASRARLARLMGGDDTPSLLLSVSHGVLVREPAEQRAVLQGGLVCSDWNQERLPMRRQDCFCGEDLDPEADLTGLIAFQFACFSVGTPQFDSYPDPGQAPDRLHHKEIISRLPQAMLAHPRGALAVIGHVDQCYQHSFLQGNTSQVSHFASTLIRLAANEPVGFAMEHFNRRYAAVSARTRGGLGAPGEMDKQTRLDLWLAWQDSRNYAVLGDPAVRLRTKKENT